MSRRLGEEEEGEEEVEEEEEEEWFEVERSKPNREGGRDRWKASGGSLSATESDPSSASSIAAIYSFIAH